MNKKKKNNIPMSVDHLWLTMETLKGHEKHFELAYKSPIIYYTIVRCQHYGQELTLKYHLENISHTKSTQST